jgi:hypothetical protein
MTYKQFILSGAILVQLPGGIVTPPIKHGSPSLIKDLNSIYGVSKSLEDTIKVAERMVPVPDGNARYRAQFAVYERSSDDQKSGVNNVIGLVGVLSPVLYGVPFPDHLTLPDEETSKKSILKMEMGYMFLPHSWGKGYCTEAVEGILQAYKIATNFWKPYEGVYFHVCVGEDNLASAQVAKKAGFDLLGLHEWDGEHVLLAGALRPPRIKVFGMLLASPENGSRQEC